MSRAFPSDRKKWEMNSEPRSDVICEGTLCFEKMWRRNSLASSGEVMVSCVGTKTHCFKRWSMMTKIEVKPEDVGNCSMKSMEMEFHGCSGTGSCLSRPNSLCRRTLARMQVVQEDTT